MREVYNSLSIRHIGSLGLWAQQLLLDVKRSCPHAL
jgi:hypothetical protein